MIGSIQLRYCLVGTVALMLINTGTSRAEELLTTEDGVRLNGTVRLLQSNAGTCSVVEDNAQTNREELRHNQERPMHLWELEFSTFNGTGRSLNLLSAYYDIDSPWPPCTNLTEHYELESKYDFLDVHWEGPSGHIQQIGSLTPTLPDQTHSTTILVLALEEVRPRFTDWSVRYGFADRSAGISPETGVSTADVGLAVRYSAEPRSAAPVNIDTVCVEGFEAECWFKLDAPLDCYEGPYAGNPEDVFGMDWSGECTDREPDGRGTMTVAHTGDGGTVTIDVTYSNGEWNGPVEIRGTNGALERGAYENGVRQGPWYMLSPNGDSSDGYYLDGRKEGHWREYWDHGTANESEEGPYVEGQRHGRWVEEFYSHHGGSVGEGPYVEGEKHGHWVERYSSDCGEDIVEEGPYIEGERHGEWVLRDHAVTSRGSYSEGRRIGNWIMEHENGRSGGGAYTDGRRTGHWTEITSISVDDGRYVDGRRVGDWVETRYSDVLRQGCSAMNFQDWPTVHEGIYGPFVGDDRDDTVKQGIWKRTFADGNSDEVLFVNGICQDC